MNKTLILKTGGTIPVIAEELGDFELWIKAGMSLSESMCLVVSVFKGQALPELDSLSSIVITGSPAMVTEKREWIESSEKFIVSAIARGIPVLGICFGHQLLAQAMGGSVDWHPRGREIGTTQILQTPEAEGDPLFKGLPDLFPVHTTHMQTVSVLPAGAQVLMRNDFEVHHAVRFTNGVWGLQFHPEFDEKIMCRYIEERSEQIRQEGLNPDALLAAVSPTPQALQILRNFASFSSKKEKGECV